MNAGLRGPWPRVCHVSRKRRYWLSLAILGLIQASYYHEAFSSFAEAAENVVEFVPELSGTKPSTAGYKAPPVPALDNHLFDDFAFGKGAAGVRNRVLHTRLYFHTIFSADKRPFCQRAFNEFCHPKFFIWHATAGEEYERCLRAMPAGCRVTAIPMIYQAGDMSGGRNDYSLLESYPWRTATMIFPNQVATNSVAMLGGRDGDYLRFFFAQFDREFQNPHDMINCTSIDSYINVYRGAQRRYIPSESRPLTWVRGESILNFTSSSFTEASHDRVLSTIKHPANYAFERAVKSVRWHHENNTPLSLHDRQIHFVNHYPWWEQNRQGINRCFKVAFASQGSDIDAADKDVHYVGHRLAVPVFHTGRDFLTNGLAPLLDTLSGAASDAVSDAVSEARSEARSFAYVFGQAVPRADTVCSAVTNCEECGRTIIRRNIFSQKSTRCRWCYTPVGPACSADCSGETSRPHKFCPKKMET